MWSFYRDGINRKERRAWRTAQRLMLISRKTGRLRLDFTTTSRVLYIDIGIFSHTGKHAVPASRERCGPPGGLELSIHGKVVLSGGWSVDGCNGSEAAHMLPTSMVMDRRSAKPYTMPVPGHTRFSLMSLSNEADAAQRQQITPTPTPRAASLFHRVPTKPDQTTSARIPHNPQIRPGSSFFTTERDIDIPCPAAPSGSVAGSP